MILSKIHDLLDEMRHYDEDLKKRYQILIYEVLSGKIDSDQFTTSVQTIQHEYHSRVKSLVQIDFDFK